MTSSCHNFRNDQLQGSEASSWKSGIGLCLSVRNGPKHLHKTVRLCARIDAANRLAHSIRCDQLYPRLARRAD